MIAAGTLNHFARDVGLDTPQDTADAVVSGEAVRVDVAEVNGTPFLNTSSIGAYPEMVRRRDHLSDRMGKWLAMTVAVAQVLRTQSPVDLVVNGRPLSVWIIFIGNCEYTPRGLSPAWRPRLEDRLLDVQYLRADLRFGRTRAVLATLLGVSEHSRSYGHFDAEEVTVVSGRAQAGRLRRRDGRASEGVRFRKRAELTVYCCRADDRPTDGPVALGARGRGRPLGFRPPAPHGAVQEGGPRRPQPERGPRTAFRATCSSSPAGWWPPRPSSRSRSSPELGTRARRTRVATRASDAT